MSNLNISECLDEAFSEITVTEELLERMQEMSCESETAYYIQLAGVGVLVGIGYELRRLNERLEWWNDGCSQIGAGR